ncbi:MAG: cell division ATP-binding protein FtsE [Rhodospirillaceae bacterium]|nr:cell division ATP-binding protein FtsE [Rhodospirillaceae bacterium]|tara:strand:- start:577 stop:1266 length:690 start_codon:yes stop_codon:yes gene_type:complete
MEKTPLSPIELRNIFFKYKDDEPYVLENIFLTLPIGSFHFLTGESGAGKTSLLSLLNLSKSPTGGEINMFGTDITKAPRSKLPYIRRKIGMIFQDFVLLDHLSTFDNVALPLRVAGESEEKIKDNVNEILTWVGLEEFIHARPVILSGGQKQRVAIARAVVNRPHLILADEPTGNVDKSIALRLMQLFIELNRIGSTIIIATHSENLIKEFPFPRLSLKNKKLTILPAY